MKQEFKAEWYDERYKVGGHKREYFKDPEKSVYYNVWSEIVKMMTSKDKVLELGCGAGQLAKLLLYGSCEYVRGYDFSKEGIKLCKSGLDKKYHDKFLVGDIYEEDIYEEDYNTIICCEVFEHLAEDLEVIGNIKVGAKVIFTVPNFDSKSHVRFFATSRDIRNRYNKLVDIKSIDEIYVSERNKIYLINCIRK